MARKPVEYDRDAARDYVVVRQGLKAPSSNWIDIRCPFCSRETRAFLWSLCGGGKRCSCGAKHNGHGTTIPVKQA